MRGRRKMRRKGTCGSRRRRGWFGEVVLLVTKEGEEVLRGG
jgi:hypothetical protein